MGKLLKAEGTELYQVWAGCRPFIGAPNALFRFPTCSEGLKGSTIEDRFYTF